MSFASEESNGRPTARRKEEEEEERRATAASSISTYYIPAALSMSDELKVTNRLFADWGQRKCAGQKRNEIMMSCEKIKTMHNEGARGHFGFWLNLDQSLQQ